MAKKRARVMGRAARQPDQLGHAEPRGIEELDQA